MHSVDLNQKPANCQWFAKANSTKQSGVSLIEVLISLLLFGISVMGYSALQTRSMQESLDNQQRSIALWRANGLIDRISANNSIDAIEAYDDSINNFDECASSPPANCAELGGAADECSSDELAQYDVWSSFCGVDGGAQSKLIDFSAALACDGACAPGVDMTITINWFSKAVEGTLNMTEAASVEQVSLEFRP